MSSHSTKSVADSETSGSMELAAKEFCIPQYVWDIANYVGGKMLSADRYNAWENIYIPAVDYKFPVNQTAKATGKTREFQYSWLRMCILGLPFLRRRMALIAKLVCFLENTVHVSSDCNSSKVYRLVTKPLQLWSSAASMLKEYDTQSEVHKTAVLKSSEFLKYHNSDVLQQLNSTWKAQIVSAEIEVHCKMYIFLW